MMPLPFQFDFKNPDYNFVYAWRAERLQRIRETSGAVDYLKVYYKDHPIDFINDWGMTFDPRLRKDANGKKLPTSFPLLLFPRQEEFIVWVLKRLENSEPGLGEKARDMGLSWVLVALGCTLCLFNDGMTIGYGSSLERNVDQAGDPKSLFWKARMFMEQLPIEFRGGWNIKKHCPQMRLIFPESGSAMIGEGGDNIGRGGRSTMYVVDEAARLVRPDLAEASLSGNTDCRIDISSAFGMANPFAQKRFSGDIQVFTYSLADDPRRDEEWIEKKKKDTANPVVWAQEYEINYAASVDGLVIEPDWVNAAVDFAETLQIKPTGSIVGAFDVADGGADLCAFGVRKGIELRFLKAWSGKSSDIMASTQQVFTMADDNACNEWYYDGDGLGAGVSGMARVINSNRALVNLKQHEVKIFQGSGKVVDPESEMVKGRLNQDFFANRKAQAWWSLRFRFQETYRVKLAYAKSVKEKTPFDCQFNPDDIISLNSEMIGKDNLSRLKIQLTQPRYSQTTLGKILIDKTPDGTKSPNDADTIMMLYAPVKAKVYSIMDLGGED